MTIAAKTSSSNDTGPGSWLDALCRQGDTDWWFSFDGTEHRDAAVAICRACPCRVDCLEWALEHNEQYGIWGGLTERQRRTILSRKHRGQP
jgi:WhiB family redox-sensing transcriptional regulator